MDQKELVRSAAERSGLSREESADLARAVLEGLAGQLSEGEARRLAWDLPEPLAEQVAEPRRRKQGAHPVPVEDFVQAVSERTGLTEDEARRGTGAVLAALRDQLSGDDYSHVMGQLPAEYAGLVQTAG